MENGNTKNLSVVENNKSSGVAGDDASPPTFGVVHPTLQQYDCHATDLGSLLSLLSQANKCPLASWCRKSGPDDTSYDIDPCDVHTWFPNDDQVAIYAPQQNDGSAPSKKYDTLTYRQLHDEIRSAPPWRSGLAKNATDDRPFVVAVLLPPEMMAEMAVVLLSIMAAPAVRDDATGRMIRRVCAAPLDPHMAPHRIVEAIDQLRCEGLVSTDDLLGKIKLREAMQTTGGGTGDEEEDRLLSVALDRLNDVRLVKSKNMTAGLAGAVEWTVFRKNGEGSIEWTSFEPSSHVYENSQPDEKKNDSDGLVQPVVMLRTSGTTATPKVVPLTPRMLIFNAISISSSLDLQRTDIDLNAMPLHHIGGIACALLSVLVSGSGVIMTGPFDPGSFLDQLESQEGDDKEGIIRPTWYYGVPTMHKSIVLIAQARLRQRTDPLESFIPNKLRFVRSGASHLSHDLALDISRVLRARVIPTYSMSECMPVCSSSTPIYFETSYDEALVGTFGSPIGPSVCIIDSGGKVMPRGRDMYGEVAIRGPGVMTNYEGVPSDETHTAGGWLKTGDVGYMGQDGQVWLKGRTKEMIKRGGEQIWPNQIDDIVGRVDGVSIAVSFGVPNELWGEEVAIAVILDTNVLENIEDNDDGKIQSVMKKKIIVACEAELDDTAVPRQVIFVSPGDLPRGPTGKYLRSRMSSHLGVSAVDTGALNALEVMVGASLTEEHPAAPQSEQIPPSEALNGLRFITACFVVHLHVGLFPNLAWVKIQSFTLNMTIFFCLGAFQLACSVNAFIDKKWASFVGTKLGAMHALFVISQLIALPAYLIFACGGGNDMCDSQFYVGTIIIWFFATLTGLLGVPNPQGYFNISNPPAWFQTVFYMFLMLFPWLDKSLRMKSRCKQWLLLIVIGIIASVAFVFLFSIGPGWWWTSYTIVTWLPALVCAMLSGYIFRRVATLYRSQQSNNDTNASERRICRLLVCSPQVWGYVADFLSIVLLVIEVLVALSDDCIYTSFQVYLEMRPGEPLPEDMKQDEYGQTYVRACDVEYEEYSEHIHNDQYDAINFGRWSTALGEALGSGRLGTPIVLLWIFALAFGRGITARIMGSRLLTALAPLAYPIYLLHAPITRIYWMATRGLEREYWWLYAFAYPIPVAWWEFFIILIISIIFGAIIDAVLTPRLMPRTVKLGVSVCSSLSRCIRCKRRETQPSPFAGEEMSTFCQIENMVSSLTGSVGVTRSTSLRNLGLDSLGATALLATLRASVPAAEKLTMADLSRMETVGELVDFLDGVEEDETVVADNAV